MHPLQQRLMLQPGSAASLVSLDSAAGALNASSTPAYDQGVTSEVPISQNANPVGADGQPSPFAAFSGDSNGKPVTAPLETRRSSPLWDFHPDAARPGRAEDADVLSREASTEGATCETNGPRQLQRSAGTVNLDDTLPEMETRKSIRRYRGAYGPSHTFASWLLFQALILVTTFQRARWEPDNLLTASFAIHVNVFTATGSIVLITWVAALLFAFFLIRMQLRYNMRWNLFVTGIFLLAQLVGQIVAHDKWRLQSVLLIIYLATQAGLLAFYAFNWHAVPHLQRRFWPLHRVNLQPVRGPSQMQRTQTLNRPMVIRSPTSRVGHCAFRYQGPFSRLMPRWWMRRHTYTLSYSGELDDEGRPHGYGEWRDTYWHGEELRGLWEHGRPVGPFKARETGSGSGFVNLHIGFLQNRRDKPENMSCWPRAAGPACGAASVECSVSGAFFRDYPLVRIIRGPDACQSDSDDVETGLSGVVPALAAVASELRGVHYAPANDSVVVTADAAIGLQVSGHTRPRDLPADCVTIRMTARGGLPEPGSDPGRMAGVRDPLLRVEQWLPLGQESKHEALLFIHGYNCPLASSLRSIAQLLALGNFPPHIKPFVFSWPTGRLPAYRAARDACTAAPTQEAFLDMVRGLSRVGFRSVHIMTHSMGVRILLAAWPGLERLMAEETAAATEAASSAVSTDSFRSMSASLRDSVPALRVASITLMNPEFPLADFVAGQAAALRRRCPLVTIYGDTGDVALRGVELVDGLTGHPCRQLGRWIYDIQDPKTRQPLDVDVVDTTWLQANVAMVRHTAFSLNSSMVEDLRDLLLSRRRACLRTSRLESRGGNVFSFLVAPTYVQIE